MQEKEREIGKETLPGNIDKIIRKVRGKFPLWTLLSGALIVGTALGVVLAHDFRRANREVLTLPVSGEQNPSGVSQAQSAAPSVPESRNIETAPMPLAAESANTPIQPADSYVPPFEDCHCTDSPSTPLAAEAGDVRAGVAGIEEVSAVPPGEPENPKPAAVKQKKAKHGTARTVKKKRHSHVKTRYVTFFPERRNYHYGFPAVSN